ncbi:unnamed protein product [Meloidogyne enterolobii]|uniref:Uncharacterized protein n=2 Tax=Meloidogyne enterolobii TaxID=390850 RepID=A0A6V7X3G4_MELEN|nr:unnamed protein product [Meloidogyne enterolobii]
MNYHYFIYITFIFVLLSSVDKTNGYCCTVNGFLGFPPHCNIFGCNCDCDKCDEDKDRVCCKNEKLLGGDCSKYDGWKFSDKRKRSLH